MIEKILLIASREFRATALTPAFIIGLVFFPLTVVISGVAAGVFSVFGAETEPMRGTIAVLDTSDGQVVADGLELNYHPENQQSLYENAQRSADLAKQRAFGDREIPEFLAPAFERAVFGLLQARPPAEVTIERLAPEVDLEGQKSRVDGGELIALVVASEASVDAGGLTELAAGEAGAGEPSLVPVDERTIEAVSDLGEGEYLLVRRDDMKQLDLDEIRSTIERAVRNKRYERVGIEPLLLRRVNRLPLNDRTTVVAAAGVEEQRNEVLVQLLPVGFAVLLLFSAVLGGNYLLLGTLEEKSSRAMEVMLSCVSTRQLMVGKLIGQGAVGLLMVVVYLSVGILAAWGSGVLQQIPLGMLPWLVLYFLMAYAFLGSIMLAVGSAVTEIREAQALFAPVTASMILPVLMMAPVLQDPDSLLSRVFSHIPPGTPFVMVARLSQPAHEVPIWELVTTTAVGAFGVWVALSAAAKIFRVGVLMYGKPPSLIGLIKMLRYD